MLADVVVSLIAGAVAGHITVRVHYWRQRRRLRTAYNRKHVGPQPPADVIDHDAQPPTHPAIIGHAAQNERALRAIRKGSGGSA